MNTFFRQILKTGLGEAAKENIRNSPQVVCFAHDSISRKIMVDGIFEKRELFALRRFLMTQQIEFETCLDVGANIGNHSLFLSELFQTVVSFEPNRQTFKVLELNAELAENVSVFNLGLSDQAETLPAEFNGLNMGGAKITTKAKGITNFEVVALDEFLKSQPEQKIDFIKVDVEGHELRAFKGAKTTLAKYLPIIAVELHIKESPQSSYEILSLLEGLKYKYAYVLSSRFALGGTRDFKRFGMAEFRKLQPKNHKMVLFSA